MEPKTLKITWEDGVDDHDALRLVKQVIDNGMLSEGRYGKGYCCVTKWPSGFIVYSARTKTMQTFIVSKGKG